MDRRTRHQIGYVADPIPQTASDLHYRVSMSDMELEPEERIRRFAALIRDAREYRGWSQDDLAERSGVSRPTIQRYEQGKTRTPDPETTRALFMALKIDLRRIPVVLGYVTEEELGLPPEAPRLFHATTEEVIEILEDPKIDPRTKAEWLEFLRFRAARDAKQDRRDVG